MVGVRYIIGVFPLIGVMGLGDENSNVSGHCRTTHQKDNSNSEFVNHFK